MDLHRRRYIPTNRRPFRSSRRRRRPLEKPHPRRDDRRGVDDVHRPDDRRDRRAADPARARAEQHRRPVGDQLVPADARRALRLRRPARRHARAQEDDGDRRAHIRRRVGPVRPHAEGRRRRGVDRHLPGRAGRGRRAHVPGRAGHRRPDVPAARARPRAGRLLRHRRRTDRDRPDSRRLPDAVDLAGDLLGQHPGRDRRAGADRDREAGHGLQAGPHRLPGARADRGRRRPQRVRLPAGVEVGLARRQDLAVHRRRPRAARRLLLRREADGGRR